MGLKDGKRIEVVPHAPRLLIERHVGRIVNSVQCALQIGVERGKQGLVVWRMVVGSRIVQALVVYGNSGPIHDP